MDRASGTLALSVPVNELIARAGARSRGEAALPRSAPQAVTTELSETRSRESPASLHRSKICTGARARADARHSAAQSMVAAMKLHQKRRETWARREMHTRPVRSGGVPGGGTRVQCSAGKRPVRAKTGRGPFLVRGNGQAEQPEQPTSATKAETLRDGTGPPPTRSFSTAFAPRLVQPQRLRRVSLPRRGVDERSESAPVAEKAPAGGAGVFERLCAARVKSMKRRKTFMRGGPARPCLRGDGAVWPAARDAAVSAAAPSEWCPGRQCGRALTGGRSLLGCPKPLRTRQPACIGNSRII